MLDKNRPNIKVLVACHKKDDAIRKEVPYMPIHVGKSLNPDLDLGFTCDDTGDNISVRNASYCELTALYWAWKNLKDVDVIGLCHYRRYFDFHNQCRRVFPIDVFDIARINNLDFSIPDKIIDRVLAGCVVVAKPKLLPHSLEIDYCHFHVSDDIRMLEKEIRQSGDRDMIKAYDEVMIRGNRLCPFNMFLMRWDDFDQYCQWLFGLLSGLEDKIDISRYSTMQKRIWGFMGERLLNVWLRGKRKKLIYKPIIKIDKPGNIGPAVYIRYVINMLRKEISSLCSRPIW